MLSFIKFTILQEDRAKDVLMNYPHLQGVDQKYLSSYGNHLGRITNAGEHTPEQINSIVGHFHDNKNALQPEQRDISQYGSLNDIHKATEPLRQKQEAKNAIDTLYDDGDTQVKEVKSKDACIKNYGGGKTNWCVAATGPDNMFDVYKHMNDDEDEDKTNRMFTVHHGKNVYAYHEGEQTFRNAKNQAVPGKMLPPEVQSAFAKVNDPDVMKANLISRNPAFVPSEEQFASMLSNRDPVVRREASIQHLDKHPQYFDRLRMDQHPDWYTRKGLASNPMFAHRFVNDSDSRISDIARQTMNTN